MNTIIDSQGNEVPLETTEKPGHATYGRQGFATAADALSDAKSSLSPELVDEAVILFHKSLDFEYDYYAWVWPRWYAERLLSTNVIEVPKE